ncbi:aminotransferase class I/II-fold pyridoxal phosphate-dependent enzyme [Anaerosphaera multitolerans]|uniref:Histidinol-phosphate aminotransferase family protein n=1 Tax=Anaerosphaera multitolerans TaxID=2487351 RepID=A0A437S5C9_9FIRM|nr:aminotransferase class I/II-fold pyridoxal phosphate-dependent enzyme [Anaerosphaera multitolerans]RVU54219.1 histidinol-phosphate aminotransferase family protein [Anaerosphaera multitolerans]
MSDLINNTIKNYIPKSYDGSNENPIIVDASLGIYYGDTPKYILEKLSRISGDSIKNYPNNLSLVDKIIEKFNCIVNLNRENITLGDGSYDLLTNINLLYLLGNKGLFSYVPNFSAYTDHAYLIGAKHSHYDLKPENNYTFVKDDFLNKMHSSNASLVFLENPNNPTGQILPIETVREIVVAAKNLNMAIIVDEAYGDYMDIENSAAPLIKEYKHLHVVRSFSKGYGLAGVRVGYSISSEESSKYLKKFISPFNCNSLGRILAEILIDDKDYIPNLISDIKTKKQTLIKGISKTKNLKIANTSLESPIMLIYTDANVNLWKVLSAFGLNTVSGLSFESLDKKSVRLIVRKEIDLIMDILLKADKYIENTL